MSNQEKTLTKKNSEDNSESRDISFKKGGRGGFLGITWDTYLKGFFGGNAALAIIILFLIVAFLFKEGTGFFKQYEDHLILYRKAGMEMVDDVRVYIEVHSTLNRFLLKLKESEILALQEQGKELKEIKAKTKALSSLQKDFRRSISEMRGQFNEMRDMVSNVRERYKINENNKIAFALQERLGNEEAAAAIKIVEVNFIEEAKKLKASLPSLKEAQKGFKEKILTLISTPLIFSTEKNRKEFKKFQDWVKTYAGEYVAMEADLKKWNPTKPLSYYRAFTSYVFGTKWTTQSFWMDWYGILPLFIGSLLVTMVALLIAVPFGVTSAIYTNQLASARERAWIKPSIEFISAIPSVVFGFFGIVVLGELLRLLSRQDWLAWVPFFPFSERLNVLTAGSLLALMAVPTIFTLTEDALNNVPRSYKEASLALGANKLQTILKIIIPSALSGIIVAVLLGMGRVIGETMVVLLCAGNRIQIPDFTEGLGVLVQPVHTMTGIIAQEMGEVARSDLQYRALFMVGITLFLISLLINYLAQKVVARFKLKGA